MNTLNIIAAVATAIATIFGLRWMRDLISNAADAALERAQKEKIARDAANAASAADAAASGKKQQITNAAAATAAQDDVDAANDIITKG